MKWLGLVILAATLTSCASLAGWRLDGSHIGLTEQAILETERRELAIQQSSGDASEISEIVAVDQAKCRWHWRFSTPQCRYRVQRRMRDGSVNWTWVTWFFVRDEQDEWQLVIIV